MATDYYQDDENKKKRRGGQGNKGRQPGSTGAPQTPKKPSNGGSKSSTSNKSSNGGGNAEGALKAGIALSKSLANASGAKKFRDAGVSALLGKEVSANDGGVSDSMDITSFNNAYGSRNTDNTGHDMSKFTEKERQRIYGV